VKVADAKMHKAAGLSGVIVSEVLKASRKPVQSGRLICAMQLLKM